MKRFSIGAIASLIAISVLVPAQTAAKQASDNTDIIVHVASVAMPSSSYVMPHVLLEGTGASRTITVSAVDLKKDVTIVPTAGFSADVTSVKAGQEATVTVTNDTYRKLNEGKVILRSGDYRTYVYLTGHGSGLEQKGTLSDVSRDCGKEGTWKAEGFNPTSNGYTVEVRAKVDDPSKVLYPFAVSDEGVGFKGYVSATGVGLYNGKDCFTSDEGLSNPSNGGTFYNTDGKYHTYRYAVTGDKRVIVYRDGITIDTLRTSDLAGQPEWYTKNGPIVENLLKNGGFEGEYDYNPSRAITDRIEGWDVYPFDQYNSYQDIVSDERSNDVDQDNHAVELHRYMWNGGWAAGEISQIVNVAPDETYSFSCLAKGGINDGSPLGSIRIYDLQNDANQQTITVTGDDYQTYATDFETKANTQQIRVSLYLERASWGASVSGLKMDDARLTGVSREPVKQIGFLNDGASVEYFAFDNTGAYAPLMADIAVSKPDIDLYGTGKSETFDVEFSNLTGDITVTATSGFSVTPTTIKGTSGKATVTVTNDTYRKLNEGKVILRSGDYRTYVYLTGYSSDLQPKDISSNPIYAGGKDEKKNFDGFNPTSKGYTVEFQAKVPDEFALLYPFAVSDEGVGFKGYVSATGVGLYNGKDCFTSDEGLSNPSNGGTFYNTDGEYHTYRYAVTPDKRVIVYRDGITIDTLRTSDLAGQPEWYTKNGRVEKNLLKNGNFEGEYDYNPSRAITDRIEGWDVYPFDQYNSYQDIVSDERSNDVDQDNHAVELHRYMWNGGWAAGEISQIVNVAPNEYYRFSCLAKGGINDGTPLGSIRIYDLQNTDNEQTLTVTGDDYKTYATEFETKANTQQIRVSLYLERASWGASVSGLKMDDARLTGVSREPVKQIGFLNDGADIRYFTFDDTGAYAPAFPTLQDIDIYTAVEPATASALMGLGCKVEDGMLRVYGTNSDATVTVWKSDGEAVALVPRYVEGSGVALPGRGTYIVLVDDKEKRTTLKVVGH